MKLHEIAKGTRIIKRVPFRLSNTPIAEGADWQSDKDTILVGLRPLLPSEMSAVISRAQETATAAGAKEWDDEHPLCKLHSMAHLVAEACVDSDAEAEPFFVRGFKQVLESPELAGSNLAYLAQQAHLWNDEVGSRDKEFTPEQLISAIVREAERPENAPERFFSLLGPSSQQSCFRSMAKLLSDLLIAKSLSGSPETTFTLENTGQTESLPKSTTKAASTSRASKRAKAKHRR